MRKPDPKQKGARRSLKKKVGKTGAQVDGMKITPSRTAGSASTCGRASTSADGRPRADRVRSVAHIGAGVDDANGNVASASSAGWRRAAFTDGAKGGNVKGAKQIGAIIAERLAAKGIRQVVFDRGGFLYHGRVRAVAEAARAAGLEF
jgi:large subunit ribosomal protein L18